MGHYHRDLVGFGGAAAALLADGVLEASAAFGLRKLRKEYAGNLIRLRRSSDNAESDFGFLPNGDLDAAAITTWLAGANGFVRTWYDQSGNARDLSQTTAANQFLYVASGQNGKPVLRADGVNDTMSTATTTLVGETHSIFIAYKAIGGTSEQFVFVLRDTVTPGARLILRRTSASAKQVVFTGAANQSLSANFVLEAFLGNGTQSIYRRDGSDLATLAITPAVDPNSLFVASENGTGNYGNHDYGELILIPTAVSLSERSAIEANINAYWFP